MGYSSIVKTATKFLAVFNDDTEVCSHAWVHVAQCISTLSIRPPLTLPKDVIAATPSAQLESQQLFKWYHWVCLPSRHTFLHLLSQNLLIS